MTKFKFRWWWRRQRHRCWHWQCITSPSTQTCICYCGQGVVSIWKSFHGVNRSNCVWQRALLWRGQFDFICSTHNSGKSIHEKVAALIIAINDPSVQVLFKAAGIIMTTLHQRVSLCIIGFHRLEFLPNYVKPLLNYAEIGLIMYSPCSLMWRAT
jgi:hypothetical protein